MLKILTEHVLLLMGHLFVAHWAHIMIETMVDVGPIGVLQAILEGFPGGLGRVL